MVEIVLAQFEGDSQCHRVIKSEWRVPKSLRALASMVNPRSQRWYNAAFLAAAVSVAVDLGRCFMTRSWLLVALLVVGCTKGVQPAATSEVPGLMALSEAGFRQHLETLAADAFEGRQPSSPAEQRTITHIASAFKDAGLSPGNGEAWFQPVPLVAITTIAAGPLRIPTVGDFEQKKGTVVWTKRVVDQAGIDASELVFVGYGIVAPEYGWDDYAGVDMAGKTAVILVNDPGFVVRDPELFNGNAMTYYGRWTYKYEEAARQGAAAALIIHETQAAGYPWEVVTGSWTGPQFDLIAEDRNLSRVIIEGWLRQDVGIRVLAGAGQDPAALLAAAAKPGFKPVPLGIAATVGVENQLQESLSNNVIGVLRGSRYPEETILYMAHWDHLGRDPSLAGDQIFNGAIDNATGTAALLELARAYGSGPRPERSVAFLSVTAEEAGLLGSQYYADNPIYPLATTVAGFNMDGMNMHGPTRDVVVVGYGSSELEDELRREAAKQERVVVREPSPEKGFFYRSDHFNFSKRGVPVLYAESGIDHRQQGSAYGRRMAWEYTALRYHKVADEYDPAWDMRGALEDMALLYGIGWQLANSREFPNWYEGTEFRAIRDATAEQRNP
jgi:Zn-dependent M28 family amino/carboxypeptidase